MSHTIKSNEVKLSQDAVRQAAAHLGWRAEMGKVELFDGTQVSGLAVSLPGWSYPLVVEADGTLVYDNYHGRWGDIKQVEALAANAMSVMAGASWPELIKEADGTECWAMEVA